MSEDIGNFRNFQFFSKLDWEVTSNQTLALRGAGGGGEVKRKAKSRYSCDNLRNERDR